MEPKILISGPPRSGKSTLIQMLIRKIREKYDILGFLTPEVRKGGNRIGFDIQSIDSNVKIPLARKGKYNSMYRLGSYAVFIEDFNNYLEENLKKKFNMFKNQNQKKILLIDEIGKMELFSQEFEKLLKKIFESKITVIATIGKTLNHPIKSYLNNLQNIEIFELARENQKKIFNLILKKLNLA